MEDATEAWKAHHSEEQNVPPRQSDFILEMLHVKRATIKQQLEQPEFQSIQQILVGELKAIDLVIQEFSQLFDIQEDETNDSLQEEDNAHETNK